MSACIDGRALRLSPLEDLDRLARADLHDRLLPAWPAPAGHAAALRLRPDLEDVDALDVDVEQLLDRLADLSLVRVGMDAERILVAGLDLLVALLRDDGCEQDLVRVQAHELALDWTTSSAPWVNSSERAHTSAEISTSPGVTTSAPSRLRNDVTTASCSSP